MTVNNSFASLNPLYQFVLPKRDIEGVQAILRLLFKSCCRCTLEECPVLLFRYTSDLDKALAERPLRVQPQFNRATDLALD